MNQQRSQQTSRVGPLEKGQVWAMKEECLAVKHVGKYLVEFTITKKPTTSLGHKPLRSFKQLMSITEVLKFLQSHKAVLSHA